MKKLKGKKKKKKPTEDNNGSICGTYHNILCVCTYVVNVQLPTQIKKGFFSTLVSIN